MTAEQAYAQTITNAVEHSCMLRDSVEAAHTASCQADGSELIHIVLLELIAKTADIQRMLEVLKREVSR